MIFIEQFEDDVILIDVGIDSCDKVIGVAEVKGIFNICCGDAK